jgi:type II secretion system protein G
MKYLLFLAIKSQGKKARGFTLIELLVVVIILGVLAAVGLPNLLGQVAKGRQAEAIAILGQINRAQQAYRYENSAFATLEQLPISGINNARYYTFSDHFAPTAIQSSYRAVARDPFNNDIKNYAGGVRLVERGNLFSLICEARSTSQDNVFVTIEGDCDGGTKFGIPSPPPTPAPMLPFRPG